MDSYDKFAEDMIKRNPLLNRFSDTIAEEDRFELALMATNLDSSLFENERAVFRTESDDDYINDAYNNGKVFKKTLHMPSGNRYRIEIAG